MTDATDPKIPADDVEGHFRALADGEVDETDDVEGHLKPIQFADIELDGFDDVEGHLFRL
jgi:hypothetical protein